MGVAPEFHWGAKTKPSPPEIAIRVLLFSLSGHYLLLEASIREAVEDRML